MEPKGSLPYSQEPPACACPESDQNITCPHSNALKYSRIFTAIYSLVFQLVFFPQVSPPKSCVPSPLPRMWHMPSPSLFAGFDHQIIWSVQIITLHIVQYIPLPCYLFSIKPKYPTQRPILEHPQSIFLPQCERPSFIPYKTTGKIVVLFILIFIFLDNKLGCQESCSQ